VIKKLIELYSPDGKTPAPAPEEAMQMKKNALALLFRI